MATARIFRGAGVLDDSLPEQHTKHTCLHIAIDLRVDAVFSLTQTKTRLWGMEVLSIQFIVLLFN